MQKLTFHRYLERYVRSLSYGNTNSIYKLVKELNENPRLEEPLFLYALCFSKADLLLKASSESPVYTKYAGLLKVYSWDDIYKYLIEEDKKLEDGYHKVYKNFFTKYKMSDTLNDVKQLKYDRIKKLQDKRKISNYRIYTDLMLNQGNINAFLKNGDVSKVSSKTVERIIEYLEAV